MKLLWYVRLCAETSSWCSDIPITDKGTVQKVVVLPSNGSLEEDLILEELEVFKVGLLAKHHTSKSVEGRTGSATKSLVAVAPREGRFLLKTKIGHEVWQRLWCNLRILLFKQHSQCLKQVWPSWTNLWTVKCHTGCPYTKHSQIYLIYHWKCGFEGKLSAHYWINDKGCQCL